MNRRIVNDVQEIEDWLASRIARELNVDADSLALDRPFYDLGLNSINTLVINGDMVEFLGCGELSPSLFWDYPTIAKLAEHLATLDATSAAD